jgi:ABC-type multidrug transport system ATPase subunit/alpha-tubulin suppressor-like RCC1 family protein
MRRRWVVAIVCGLLLLTLPAGLDALAQNGGALTSVSAFTGGGGHALAVKSDGSLYTWGYNSNGQLGLGRSGSNVLLPTRNNTLRNGVSNVAGGEFHSLALKRDGTVWAFGENSDGQLGSGSTGAAQGTPTQVVDIKGAAAIDADGDRSYAALKDGTVWAWGVNTEGELGNGSTKGSPRPVRVSGLTGISALAAGSHHTLALAGKQAGAKQGTVYGWGEEQYGQVGDGKSCKPGTKGCIRTTPTEVRGLNGKVVAIASAQLGEYSLALMEDGTVMSWGRNNQGQLGRGTKSSNTCTCIPTPGRVKGLKNVKAIAASGGAGAALKEDGSVWTWGNNKYGQLGNGSAGTADRPTPGQVQGLGNADAIAAGGGFILARTGGGALFGWGINGFGEVGVGNQKEAQPKPVAVGVEQAVGGSSLPVPAALLWILLGMFVAFVLLRGSRYVRRPAPAGPAGAFEPWSGGAMPLYTPPARRADGERANGETQVLDRAWREWAGPSRLLGRMDLFEDLSDEDLREVASALRPLSAKAGSIVSSEDSGQAFFLVETGTLASTADIGGEPRELARLGPGDFFGEAALLGQANRSGTVRAVTDAELWTLGAAEFQDLLGRHPSIEQVVRRASDQRGGRGESAAFEIEERSLADLAANGQDIRIGRTADNEIVFESPLVSRHHAVIEKTGNGFRLRDLGSVNGTYLNGVPVRSADLNDGDEVWVGDERLVFDRRAVHRSIEPHGIRLDANELNTVVRGDKQLLHDISLSILPGEFVAIVGGSGAGKTTLMDALSGVRPATSGRVLYNGRDYYRQLAIFRSVLGYVPQDDIIHTELPLRLTLRHSAKLRLPPDTTKEELDAAVDTALVDLELTGQADVRVGQLSGGQRKRSSIGVELLTRPRIFFLDEPTSGLDPFTDGQMMRLLRRLADAGSTVTLTTHATKNVMLCDKVVFLARGGQVAFVGTPRRALSYFEADGFDDIYGRLAEELSPEEWATRFRESDDYRQLRAEQLLPSPAAGDGAAPAAAGSPPPGGLARGLRQFAVLSRRSFDLYAKNPKVLPSLIMPPILFSLLALALFNGNTFTLGENSALALQVLFLVAFSSFIFGLLFAVQEIVKEFPIFRRERMVNLGVAPYVLSKTTFLAPLLTLLILVMVGILRVTGRLPDAGFDVYGPLLVTLILTGFVGLALALFTSAIVSSSQQATDMLSVWIMPQVLFGGALVAVLSMNIVGKVIAAVSPVRWSFEALGQIADLDTQFRVDQTKIGAGLAIQYGDTFTRDHIQNWVILAVMIVVPLVLTCVVLRRRTETG